HTHPPPHTHTHTHTHKHTRTHGHAHIHCHSSHFLSLDRSLFLSRLTHTHTILHRPAHTHTHTEQRMLLPLSPRSVIICVGITAHLELHSSLRRQKNYER